MNIKDAYIHNGEAILKDIQISGSKLQKLKAGKNADDTYLTWVDVLDLSPFGASGHNHDDRYVKKGGDTMTGLLTTTSGGNHKGIKVGDTYINAIGSDLIFQNNGTIRFGGDSWDYNVWAGLKYVHSSKTIYLGLADGSAFTANSAQSGGKLYTPGISDIYIGNGTYTVYHTNNLSIKTLMGTTAIGDSDEPVYWNGSSFVKASAYPTKASWNYDDRYLKLTGGKITGPVTFEISNDRKIYINNSDNETYWSLISFQQKGTEYGTLGTAGSTDLQWNGHNLYHAGNLTASVIGGLGTLSNNISGNAATATNANFFVGCNNTITVAGDANTYYPVMISTTTNKKSPNIITIWKDLGSKTASYPENHSNGSSSMLYRYDIRNCYWDGNGGYCTTLDARYMYARLVSETMMLSNGVGNFCIWLRGGGTEYRISTSWYISSSDINIYYSSTNVGSSAYPVTIAPRTDIGNGGVYNTITIPCNVKYAATANWATSAGSANEIASKGVLDSQEKIDNFITPNRFEYALFNTANANNVDFASNDGMLLSIPWNSTVYGVQLAFDDTLTGTIKVRGKSNTWGNWYTLLHSGNYTTYTVKKDGTGASGTWGISITGNAKTATNAGYATNAGNTDTVDNYHAMSAGGLFYKYEVTATIPASSVTGDFWYATIIFERSYVRELTRSMLDTSYSNIQGQVYLNTYEYDGAWYAFATNYNGCNIKGISYKCVNNPIYYIKLAKPKTYNNTLPAGKITVYSPYNCTITVSATAPSGVTFTNINCPGFTNFKANSAYSADSATTSTYASNVGSSGTAGTNYVTAANVISMYNWYNSITATDEASNTAIDKWNEIVSFLAGITDTSTLSGILAGYAAAGHNHDKTYLKLSGGNVTGQTTIRKDLTGNLSDWVSKQHLGPFEVGRATNSMCVAIGVTDDNYGYIQVKGSNITTPGNLVLLPGGGNLTVGNSTNTVYHKGNLSIATLMGSTAIGDSDEPVYWNGSKFVKAGAYPTKSSWNYDDRYLKLSGGTLTGVLHLLGSKYEDSANTGAIDLANSDIYGVNSIKFADLAESAGEGLQWYRDATHVDSLWVNSGVIYFSPNRTWGGTVTNYTVWHSGNDGSGSGLDADLLDGKHASDFSLSTHTHDYIAKLRRLNEVFGYSSFASGMFPPALFELKTAGYPVYSDPEFASGYNEVYVYNNYGNGTVTITREQAGDHTNSSGFQLKITTAGEATPGCGGFYQLISSRANAIFVQIFRAKIPVGYNVNTASNPMGTNYQDRFITDRAGTGKWEWYARVVYCDSSGSFSIGGHVYLSANSGYSTTSVTWYLSYCNVIDITKGAYDGLRTRYADSADSVVWGNVTEKPTTISGYGITDALKIDGSNGTAEGVSALINKLSVGSSDPTDADYYVCQYAGGGTTTTTYHRRPMSAMWNWIKVKTNTLYPTKTGSGASGTWDINVTGSAKRLESNSSTNVGGLSYYYIGGSTFNATVDGSWSGYSTTTNYNSIVRVQSHTGTAKYYIDLIFDVNNSEIYYRRVTNNSLANIRKIDVYEVPESTASYSLSNASWVNTITLPTTAGSYILNIVSGNSTLTGVFSIGASDNAKDEISLHLHGNGPRLYARTNGTTLQLSSNDTSATSRSVTIKYRRMI